MPFCGETALVPDAWPTTCQIFNRRRRDQSQCPRRRLCRKPRGLPAKNGLYLPPVSIRMQRMQTLAGDATFGNLAIKDELRNQTAIKKTKIADNETVMPPEQENLP